MTTQSHTLAGWRLCLMIPAWIVWPALAAAVLLLVVGAYLYGQRGT